MKKMTAFPIVFLLLAGCSGRQAVPVATNVTVSLAFAGDVMLDRGVKRELLRGRDQFRDTRDIFKNADIAFYNQETPVTTRGEKYDKPFNFRVPAEALSNVVSCGFDVCNLANNHSMDYGPDGMQDTLSNLDALGIAHAGAGMDAAEAEKPAILTRNGIRVGYLAAGDTWPLKYYAAEKHAGIAGIDTKLLAERIAALRPMVDYLVLSLHWGAEYLAKAEKYQIDQAHAFIDAGADLVIGHGPHVLQGVESYRGKAVFYSLGNFVFDQRNELPTRFTMIPLVTLTAIRRTNGSLSVSQEVRFRPFIKSFEDFAPCSPDAETNQMLISHILRISRHLNAGREAILTNAVSNGFVKLSI